MEKNLVMRMDALSTALDSSRNQPLMVALAMLETAVANLPPALALEACLHMLLIQHRRINTMPQPVIDGDKHAANR